MKYRKDYKKNTICSNLWLLRLKEIFKTYFIIRKKSLKIY